MSSDTAPYRVRPAFAAGTFAEEVAADGWHVMHIRTGAARSVLIAHCIDEATAQILADALNAQPVTP